MEVGHRAGVRLRPRRQESRTPDQSVNKRRFPRAVLPHHENPRQATVHGMEHILQESGNFAVVQGEELRPMPTDGAMIGLQRCTG